MQIGIIRNTLISNDHNDTPTMLVQNKHIWLKWL